MRSQTDEHNNMLRGLYAAVGAVWGGVDGLIIHGYDALSATKHGHRIAQNMHAVLKEESGLDGWRETHCLVLIKLNSKHSTYVRKYGRVCILFRRRVVDLDRERIYRTTRYVEM